MSTWPETSPTGGSIWSKVNLTEVVTYLATRCLCPGGMSDERSPQCSINTLGHKMSLPGVHLTKGQPEPKIWQKCKPDPRFTQQGWYIWPEVNLTEVVTHLATRCCCQEGPSDQRSAWPKDLTKMSTWSEASYMGYIWLSAERLSENLNTLCVLGLVSQRSFLWKTNDIIKGPAIICKFLCHKVAHYRGSHSLFNFSHFWRSHFWLPLKIEQFSQ